MKFGENSCWVSKDDILIYTSREVALVAVHCGIHPDWNLPAKEIVEEWRGRLLPILKEM